MRFFRVVLVLSCVWAIGLAAGMKSASAGSRQAAPDDRAQGDRQDASHRLPAWSPDEEWIAFHSEAGGRGNIWLARPDGSDLTNITADAPLPVQGGPLWSPDGQWLLFGVNAALDPGLFSRTDVWLYSMEDEALVEVSSSLANLDSVRRASWSPDSQSLALVVQVNEWTQTQIWLWEMTAPESPQVLVEELAAYLTWLDWLPDGQRLIFELTPFPEAEEGVEALHIISRAGQPMERLPLSYPTGLLNLSPDGESVLVTGRQADSPYYDIMRVDLATGETHPLTNSPYLEEGAPRWSPDGTRFAYVDGFRKPAVMTVEGQNTYPLTETCDGVIEDFSASVAWSPDGAYLAVAMTPELYAAPTDIWIINVNDPADCWNLTGELAFGE
jgi:Tol biopolymer transport system component